MPRVPAMLDLVRALGWLDPARYLDSPLATEGQLTRYHTPDYVAALRRAEADQAVSPEVRERHHLGAHGNPVYREVFRRPATSAGGAILAARLTRGGGIAHVPGAGTHHALPDRASGFCYINDPVLGLLEWLDLGLTNILYVDIDAHHGDGVELAFRKDPRVFTLSVHEAGRWPFTGRLEDRAGGYARNIPVPQGFNDTEMDHVLHAAILPILRHLRPAAVMLQCGADALEEDPLARLSLSNNAHAAVAAALRDQAPRLIVTGGGGYNPWTVARCWAAVWGTLDRRAMPEHLPPEAEAVLRALTWDRAAGRRPPEHWFTTLIDSPRPGSLRAEVVAACEAVLEGLPEPATPEPAG
ncbi:acetoin utilization protein AcuC [Muricoccus vinaceus]